MGNACVFGEHNADANNIWYTREGIDKVNNLYLLSVFLAPAHKQPVPHLANISEYQTLVDAARALGPHLARRRKSKMLDMATYADHDWPEDVIPLHQPQRRRRGQPRVHLEIDGDEDAEGEEEGRGGGGWLRREGGRG